MIRKKKSPQFDFQCMVGVPNAMTLREIVDLNQTLFRFNETVEALSLFFSRQRLVLLCLVRVNGTLVGFKIGLLKELNSVESWRGGVLPHWQRRGLGAELMRLQHTWCQKNGVRFIRTVSDADNTAMLALNQKFGFREVSRVKNDNDRVKIHQILDLP